MCDIYHILFTYNKLSSSSVFIAMSEIQYTVSLMDLLLDQWDLQNILALIKKAS